MQATWGADFATRFGGIKVTLPRALLLSCHPKEGVFFVSNQNKDFEPKITILGPTLGPAKQPNGKLSRTVKKSHFWSIGAKTQFAEPRLGWMGSGAWAALTKECLFILYICWIVKPSNNFLGNQISNIQEYISLNAALPRLPARCRECLSPSSTVTPTFSATSNLRQISERLTSLRSRLWANMQLILFSQNATKKFTFYEEFNFNLNSRFPATYFTHFHPNPPGLVSQATHGDFSQT